MTSAPDLTEVIWAKDGRSFVINGSDGGAEGTWEAWYYRIEKDGIPVYRDIASIVLNETRDFPECEDEEILNFGVVGWDKDQRHLLIVAEVPPHSSCKNMGAVEGIILDLDANRVAGKIDEVSLRKKWKSFLGPRFN